MEVKEILRCLTLACGVSGREGSVAEAAKEMLAEYMPVRIDKSGSVIGQTGGEGRKILLDAHIDEIGLIVTSVHENGFLKASPVGGADRRVLIGSKLTVWGSRAVNAVVCSTPPHLAGGEKNALEGDIIIDTGLSDERAEKLVRVGDTVTFRQELAELAGGRVSAKSLDDRAGIAVLLRAVDILGKSSNDVNLTVVFSVQEEVGTRGAGTAAFSVMPDEAIAVDVSFACAPGVPEEKSGKLGGGPMIGISPILDRGMTDKLFEIAEGDSIPHQAEVMNGSTGTNADPISLTGGGVRTALVSVPLRNMHTPVEIIDTEDIENCAKLIARYVEYAGGVEK